MGYKELLKSVLGSIGEHRAPVFLHRVGPWGVLQGHVNDSPEFGTYWDDVDEEGIVDYSRVFLLR